MSQTKKQYSPQFKAKVALEAVEGVESYVTDTPRRRSTG